MLKLTICQRNRNQNNKTWYLRTFDTETKHLSYRSLNTERKGEALDLLVQEKQKANRPPEMRRLYELPSLCELCETWLRFIEVQNSAKTANQYRYAVSEFKDFCEKNGIMAFKDFSQVNANELVNGKADLEPTTRKNKKAVFRSFFNWVIDTYELETKNVFKKVRTPKQQRPLMSFWTLEEEKKILENTESPLLRLCFAFMAYAGMRVGEATSLKWSNVSENGLEIVNGKGGKSCVLPMAPLLKKEIELFLSDNPEGMKQDGGAIFGFSKMTVYEKLKEVCARIGIDGRANPHKFRHSFASNLLRAGANIVAVSRLMRHSSPTMTLNIYSHVMPSDLGETLEKLGGNG